jgi:hypothetical protein
MHGDVHDAGDERDDARAQVADSARKDLRLSSTGGTYMVLRCARVRRPPTLSASAEARLPRATFGATDPCSSDWDVPMSPDELDLPVVEAAR